MIIDNDWGISQAPATTTSPTPSAKSMLVGAGVGGLLGFLGSFYSETEGTAFRLLAAGAGAAIGTVVGPFMAKSWS